VIGECYVSEAVAGASLSRTPTFIITVVVMLLLIIAAVTVLACCVVRRRRQVALFLHVLSLEGWGYLIPGDTLPGALPWTPLDIRPQTPSSPSTDYFLNYR